MSAGERDAANQVANELPSADGLRVVFLCTHNSARSQMAEALLRHDYGDSSETGSDVTAYSAGTVARGVHPCAHQALREVGIDTGSQRSKTIEDLREELLQQGAAEPLFDVVVTVCDNARESCPYLPARVLNLHRQFADPSAGEGSESEMALAFAATRDQIRDWLRHAVPEWRRMAEGTPR